MTDRERELFVLLAECRSILVLQAFMRCELRGAFQPIINRIDAALSVKDKDIEA